MAASGDPPWQTVSSPPPVRAHMPHSFGASWRWVEATRLRLLGLLAVKTWTHLRTLLVAVQVACHTMRGGLCVCSLEKEGPSCKTKSEEIHFACLRSAAWQRHRSTETLPCFRSSLRNRTQVTKDAVEQASSQAAERACVKATSYHTAFVDVGPLSSQTTRPQLPHNNNNNTDKTSRAHSDHWSAGLSPALWASVRAIATEALLLLVAGADQVRNREVLATHKPAQS